MKRRTIDTIELWFLREQVERRYRADGGTELEWRSYLPRYDDLNARIRSHIHGTLEAAISPNILRRLFWDTRNMDKASFNVVYLNAFARYISEGEVDYRGLVPRIKPIAVERGEMALTSPVVKELLLPASESTSPSADQGGNEGLVVFNGSVNEQSVRTSVAPSTEAGSQTRQELGVFLRPFLVAAIYSGLLSFCFVLLLNEFSGYMGIQLEDLRKLMISWFGFTVFGHLVLGLALGYLSYKQHRAYDEPQFFRRFYAILPILFMCTFYCRQLFVSSGWLIKGDQAAGFFGKPDLETVAIALSLCAFIVLFVRSNRKKRMEHHGPAIWDATVFTLVSGTLFFAVAALHNILVSENLLDPNGSFIAPYIFAYRFPHPERLPLICFMVFTQSFLTLRMTRAIVGSNDASPVKVAHG